VVALKVFSLNVLAALSAYYLVEGYKSIDFYGFGKYLVLFLDVPRIHTRPLRLYHCRHPMQLAEGHAVLPVGHYLAVRFYYLMVVPGFQLGLKIDSRQLIHRIIYLFY
jgi:hypothetical protein